MYPNKRYIDFTYMSKMVVPTTFYEKGNSLQAFWASEYVSSQSLLKSKFQTSPDEEESSVRQQVEWLANELNLQNEKKVLVLGCHLDGIYPMAFAKAGFAVTSIDSSRMLIDNATEKAKKEKVSIEYICKNFNEIEYKNKFDLVFLTDCSFGAFSEEFRDSMLKKIHTALKPGSFFAFNVYTRFKKELTKTFKDWIVHPNGGFFSPTAHVELINHVHYESQGICLDQHTIFDHVGQTHIYNLWDTYYSVKGLVNVLKKFNFKGVKLTKDFTGTTYQENDETIAMIVRNV